MIEVLPLLYLHGPSRGDFIAALGAVPRRGLSASTIARLTAQWQDEAAAFGRRRDLPESDYVYLWVDGDGDGEESLHDEVKREAIERRTEGLSN